jgi:hypothetical protein
MREYNFFSFFKMTLKIHFFVGIKICKNFIEPNFIPNRLEIILRLLLISRGLCEKDLFLSFFTNLLKNKKAAILK